MVPLIALLTFGAVTLGTLALARPGENRIRRRALGVPPPAGDQPAPRLQVQGSLARRVIVPLVAKLGRMLGRFLPPHLIQRSEQLLRMADDPWSLASFLGITAMSATFGLAFLLYTLLALELRGLLAVALGLIILPLFTFMPFLRVRSLARKRQQAITRALPDAMDLLVTSVEAGLGVDAAFAVVAEKMEGPLAEAFALYLRQVGLGRHRSEALSYVAERTGVPDFIRVATSVNQGMSLGTPIGDVLRVQAEELRVARRQRAQVAAQRAPVLMTIPLALCFLPATAAVVIVPSIMNFIRFIDDLGG